MREAGIDFGWCFVILALAAAIGFQPVMAQAEVTTSNGKSYRVETCFRDPRHLQTRFVYPDRSATFSIDGDVATTAENGAAPAPAGDGEKRFAIGHNFHAIHYNFAQLVSDRRRAKAIPGNLRPGWTGTMEYGGSATSLYSVDGRAEGYWFELPGTTPIELHFSDWRDGGQVPYRLELTHAGVTYDYRYTKIEFRC